MYFTAVSTTPARNKPIPQKYVGVKFRPNPSSQAPQRMVEANLHVKKIEMANTRHPGFLISEIMQKP